MFSLCDVILLQLLSFIPLLFLFFVLLLCAQPFVSTVLYVAPYSLHSHFAIISARFFLFFFRCTFCVFFIFINFDSLTSSLNKKKLPINLCIIKLYYIFPNQSIGLRVRRIWSLNSWSSVDLLNGLRYRSCRRTRTIEIIWTISSANVRPMKRFLLFCIQSISLGLQPTYSKETTSD